MRRSPHLFAAAASIASMATAAAPAGARIDHVIVGVADMERGIAEIERLTGVRPVVGGTHPGRGTRNALMSLGDGTYLELLAPNPAEPMRNEEQRELRSLSRPAAIGWAVSANDATALRAALDGAGLATSEPEPGSRAKPDGATLNWVTFEFTQIDDPLAPFFIAWSNPQLHPSRTSPAGCRLISTAIASPLAGHLRRAIAALRLDVTVANARQRRMRITLACPAGRITL
jgi:hypothetical protein